MHRKQSCRRGRGGTWQSHVLGLAASLTWSCHPGVTVEFINLKPCRGTGQAAAKARPTWSCRHCFCAAAVRRCPSRATDSRWLAAASRQSRARQRTVRARPVCVPLLYSKMKRDACENMFMYGFAGIFLILLAVHLFKIFKNTSQNFSLIYTSRWCFALLRTRNGCLLAMRPQLDMATLSMQHMKYTAAQNWILFEAISCTFYQEIKSMQF